MTALVFHNTVFDAIIPFAFDDSLVRIHNDEDGKPWFVAKDVCAILGIQNPSDTVSKVLDDDERGIDTIYTPSGDQEMLVVSESGLYSLVFRSRKPEAKRFRKWVTAEVLPALRETGGYNMNKDERTALERMNEVTRRAFFKELSLVARENPDRLQDFFGLCLLTISGGAGGKSEEPAEVAKFWQVFASLEKKTGCEVNRSTNPRLIAVNLPRFLKEAEQAGHFFDTSSLRRNFPKSQTHAFVAANKGICDRVTRKTTRCWVFQRGD